jgi:hypothetical protein
MPRLFIAQYSPAWSTHIPLLMKVFSISSGSVLELGIGPASTPLLHQLCMNTGRKLVSYESNEYYFERHRKFRNENHEIHFVTNWDDINIDTEWGLVFVDHAPDFRRKIETQRVANKAQYIIVHDTQPSASKHYHFETVLPNFRYRFNYTKVEPNTSVVSNFVDVTKLEV